MHIHQFHPTVIYGDAVSNQILNLQHLLQRVGYQSEIFCEHAVPSQFSRQIHPLAQYTHYSSPANILLLHFSLGYSPAVLAWLERLPDRKVIIYHNITPHKYFWGINNALFEAAQAGREQLSQLRLLSEAGWGVSKFNYQELAECGWSKLGVLPVIFNPEQYAVKPDKQILTLKQNSLKILFVGRVAPNKRFEDLILVFYYLKHRVQPNAQLFLVGSAGDTEPYFEFLQALIDRLGLSDVFFTRDRVTTSQLIAYYQCADVYLSMSDHEGFGVPLLESMYFGLPIIAYKTTAVPETLGSSGILVTTKDHIAIAELIGLLDENKNLKARLIAGQKKRLQNFLPEKVTEQLQILLQELGV